MRKLKVLFMRFKDASFKRMKMHIDEISKESGKLRIIILLDMLWCVLKYRMGYLDYHVFGFAYIHGKKRKTFMMMNDNIDISERVNDKEYTHIFANKNEFLDVFRDYTGRGFLDLRSADIDTFESFLKESKAVFAKPINDFGGHGVQRIRADEVYDYSKLYNMLKGKKRFLIEQPIIQHPTMNKLNDACINTLRMVTLIKNGKPEHIYTLIRVGSGKGVTDNISGGGMYAPIWEDGKIAKPAFCDATGLYYDEHPLTKTKFVGFEIPFYNEAVEMIKKAALVVPQVGYVGWDVAITPDGPVLVEGNDMPGYDMCQNYHHLRDDKTGILPRFL